MGFSHQTKSHSPVRSFLSACLLIFSVSLLSMPVWSQDAASQQSNFSISQLSPDYFPGLANEFETAQSDTAPTAVFNPYSLSGLEPAIESGIVSQESGQHAVAISAFDKALQITRIKYGLYHEAQIPLLEGIIVSGMEMRDWELVDERYAYMEHLYRKLYATDDPRLERGLQKISSFHVNAFNINLDGRREYHLRRAANLFRARLEVAENTLAEDHPRLEYLNEGIEISRHHLYRLSSTQREQHQSTARDRLLADLD